LPLAAAQLNFVAEIHRDVFPGRANFRFSSGYPTVSESSRIKYSSGKDGDFARVAGFIFEKQNKIHI
jgi:hypothetical protein